MACSWRALALFATLAHAEDYLSPTEERVRLSLGVVRLSNETNMQLDSSAGVPGTPINAEDAFGLDKTDFEAKIEAMVRVGERHRLRFRLFHLGSHRTTTIVTRPIVFRDVVLQPGDPVGYRPLDSHLRHQLRILVSSTATNTKLAATIGVNDTDISARARVPTATRHVDQTEDQAGPFPTVGLDCHLCDEQAVLSRWPRAVYEGAPSIIWTASLGIYEFDALYRLRPNISFALGYSMRAGQPRSRRRPSKSGYFNFDSKGPEFFVRVAF